MSTNLYWRLLPSTRASHDLSIGLKQIFGPRFWDHDGGLSGEPLALRESVLPYLEGLRDSRLDPKDEVRRDVEKLIEAIKKHGGVEILIAE